MSEENYKGYTIKGFEDGLFDIEQGDELVDGNFKSIDDCKTYIDNTTENQT